MREGKKMTARSGFVLEIMVDHLELTVSDVEGEITSATVVRYLSISRR